jgi:hypothetical protein
VRSQPTGELAAALRLMAVWSAIGSAVVVVLPVRIALQAWPPRFWQEAVVRRQARLTEHRPDLSANERTHAAVANSTLNRTRSRDRALRPARMFLTSRQGAKADRLALALVEAAAE